MLEKNETVQETGTSIGHGQRALRGITRRSQGKLYFIFPFKCLFWHNFRNTEKYKSNMVSRMYEELLQLSLSKKNQLKKKNGWKAWIDFNRHFSEKGIQVVNKHMKRCSTSLEWKSQPRWDIIHTYEDGYNHKNKK